MQNELGYKLLTKEEQNSSVIFHRSKNAVARIIQRFSLPEATDAIGKKKELIEKVQLLILFCSLVGVFVGVLVWNYKGYPQVVSSIAAHNTTHLPVLGFCFPNSTFVGWLPWVWRMAYRENFHTEKKAWCEFWRPTEGDGYLALNGTHFPQLFNCSEYRIVEACKPLVSFNKSLQCLTFGNSECIIWQSLLKTNVVELQFFSLWESILEFPTTMPGGWYNNTEIMFSDVTNYNYPILLGGISQAVLEFRREEEIADGKVTVKYQKSIITLNVLENHFFGRNGVLDTNHMQGLSNPFSSLELQIRLTTNRISTTNQEGPLYFIYRSVKDIGGFLGALFTFITILISTVLTRIIFSKRDAFFDAQVRLAVAHFLKEQNNNTEADQ